MQLALQKRFSILTIFMLLTAVLLTASSQAEARYSVKDAFKTIGIATAIGTVLGLSTLPFYDAPFKHTSNVYIGAGAGLVAGLGIATYLFTNSYFSEEEEIDTDELLVPKKVSPKADSGQQNAAPQESSAPPVEESPAPKKSDDSGDESGSYRVPRENFVPSVPNTAPNPALAYASAPKQWVVAVRILELRF